MTRWHLRTGPVIRTSARVFALLTVLTGFVAGLSLNQGTARAQAAAFAVGDTVVVNTDLLNLREEPSLDAYILHIFNEGNIMTVTGAPTEADGYTWYPVDAWVKGTESGWVAGEFLRALTAEDSDNENPVGFPALSSVRVDTDVLNVRSGPGFHYPTERQLTQGRILVIEGGPITADGFSWYAIVLPDQSTPGWVAGEYLTLVSEDGTNLNFTKGAEVVVDTDFLNLRAGAGLSKTVLDVFASGTALVVSNGPMTADGYDWYEVETLDGDLGWVAGAYLAIAADAGGYDGFAIGETAVVDTVALNFRTGPGLDYDVALVIAGGTEVVIVDGPVSADGYHWYKLEMENGDIGWSIGEGLA